MALPQIGVYPYQTNRGYNVAGHPRGASIIYHQQWTNPAAADDNGYLTTTAGPNAATAVYADGLNGGGLVGALVSGGIAKPDFARNVVITVTHASAVVAESGTITGLDAYGRRITEAWSVTAGGTSKVFTGAKAFSRIISVSVTAATDASTNSNIIGTGVVFGLDVKMSVASAVKERVDGSIVTNGTFVAAGTGTADARGTYSPNTAPDGAHDYDVWYISDDPEAS
jgi:hypothetical protein